MRTLSLAVFVVATAAVAWWATPDDGGSSTAAAARGPAAVAAATESFADALDDPRFVPNLGQWHDEVRYAVLGDTAGWLHDDGFTLRYERWSQRDDRNPVRSCRGAVVRTRFVGADPDGFEPARRHASRWNFLVGAGDRHRTGVPSFGAVTMRRALPGIDVHFRPLPEGDADGGSGPFEYDLLLAAGADLADFVAECEGVAGLRVDADGRLVAAIETPDGVRELVQRAPIAWQETARGRQPVDVRFRLLGPTRYGFVADGLDPALATVVDPGVVWGSFVGGGASDRIYDVQLSAGNEVHVAGWAGSTDLPTTVGAFATTGGADAFVARLSSDGSTLQFGTYLGGSNSEQVRGLAVAADGSVTVVGFTASTDLPTTPGAAQPTFGGSSVFLEIGDTFVTRLSANGSALLGSTYAGGLFDEVAEGVVLDANGDAIVVGWTTSSNFPGTAGGFQPALGGIPIAQSDGFVLAVRADGTSFPFGTYLGAGFSEQLLAIDRDPISGDLVVGGWVLGQNYPVTPGAYRQTFGGAIDGTIARLNANASALKFATFFGGADEESVEAVRFAVDGSVWVAGFTDSGNFPFTPGAVQTAVAGDVDAFVSHLSATGQTLVYSTLLGGPEQDRARAIDVVGDTVLVVGEAGPGFPVTPDAAQGTFAAGGFDAFVTYLTNDGGTMSWSTYFGGGAYDVLLGVDLTATGLAVVAGGSFSTDFPVAPAALQPLHAGSEDGVVLVLDLLSDLGPGIEVEPLAPTDVQLVDDGTHELLRFELTNVLDQAVRVDGVRVFVGGYGVPGAAVFDLRMLAENGTGPAQVVAGPLAPPLIGETVLSPQGLVVPAQASVVCRIEASLLADVAGGSAEVVAGILDASAWQLRENVGGGRSINVVGSGRVTGPVLVLGAVAGDLDRSGSATVIDLRRLVAGLGSTDVQADLDGDGVLTTVDLDAAIDVMLGRTTLFGQPGQVVRGEWLRLPCRLPSGAAPRVTLGTRILRLGAPSPRELSVRVPADQPAGFQRMVIRDGQRVLFDADVQVF